MHQLEAGPTKDFKYQTIYLSYLAAASKSEQPPDMYNIDREIITHFWQEFALEVQIHDRYQTYGALNADDFMHRLKYGVYDQYAPTEKEILDVLNYFQFPFFDWEGYIVNSSLQGVW